MDMTRSPLLLVLFFMHQSSADSNCLWPSDDGRCTDCKRGWHGDSCNYKCFGFCDVGGCDSDTGRCIQCGAGYHATNCTETCPPNCRYSHGDKPYCNRETGNCLENCQGGWWGKKCENKCSGGCEDNSCYFWDGSCARGCRNGWAGDSCDTRCPGGCHGDTCEQYGSHKCTQGCKHGVHGHHCNKQCNRHCRDQDCFYDHSMKSTVCRQGCVDGWMSLDCKLKCPGNCEACSQETGECSRCKQGYWGSDCTRTCSATCFNKTCDRDGRCRSCQLGYHGDNCENRCGTACDGCLETHEPCRCKDKCDVTCLPITHDSRECPDEDDVNTSGSYRPGDETLVVVTVVVFSLNLKQ
ncbi:scavenger receptor class F member 1-like [Haliotis cracherodii]|uniref:scavenger receptor class F member 1-like n=1 Tax=Haliotis cracherodii TaxID=6455 RepID=UPI0039E7BECC